MQMPKWVTPELVLEVVAAIVAVVVSHQPKPKPVRR